MTSTTGNLYLTGFMGVGKSTVGQAVADALHRQFVDMDEALVAHFGKPIAAVFAEDGEAVFRQAERALLRRLARRGRLVVATGGGVPADAANRETMRASGQIVLLDGSPDRLRERLSAAAVAQRPLWQDAAAVQALYERRREAYADHDFRVDALLPEVTAKVGLILRQAIPDSRIPVRLDGRDCPVMATADGPGCVGTAAAGRRIAMLTDNNLARTHLPRYREALPGALEIVVPAGEGAKSLRQAEKVYRAMLEARLERGDLLVALGGGVITDLGAFVAATYKRGMDAVLVSTSLLGCVDAAVGGKSAVNLSGYKNQVGLFTVPKLVVLDLAALGTLPRPQVREGLVEAYKTGLALRPALATFIEDHLPSLLRGDLPGLAEVARVSAEAKGEVVTTDFRERGLRRVLNLGHTYGHAVETWHRCRFSHGHCVAVGMQVMTELSRGRGWLDAAEADRILAHLRRLAPRPLPMPAAETAWTIMLNDKKNVGGKVTFVLLDGTASHRCVDDVTCDELQQAIARVQESQAARRR